MIALCLKVLERLPANAFHAKFYLKLDAFGRKFAGKKSGKSKNTSLLLTSARVRGSGAGMEPPLGSVFREGAWHYTPHIAPLKQLLLAHSPYTKEYDLCIDFT